MVFDLLMPVYNEEDHLKLVIEKIILLQTKLKEKKIDLNLIIIDDCSKDLSLSIANECSLKYNWITVLKHNNNLGKGAALKTGLLYSTGDYIGIQDSDLEYDPMDYVKLIELMQSKNANVVYGSRYLKRNNNESLFHIFVNKFLTLLFNVCNGVFISDMETCYKLFSTTVKNKFVSKLKEKRFGFEVEVSSYIVKMGYKIYETSIGYTPRNYVEGKKINYKDGLRAIYCIFRYSSKKILLLYLFLFLILLVLVCK